MPRGGARKGAGRPPGQPHRTRSIVLPESLWEAVEGAAEDLGESVNAVVRHAVQLWLTLDRDERAIRAKKE